MTDWSVMKSTWLSLQGPLGKTKGTFQGIFQLFMTMTTSHVTIPVLTVFPLWVVNHATLIGPSQRPYT